MYFQKKRCRDCRQAHNTLLHEASAQHENDAGASNSSIANVSNQCNLNKDKGSQMSLQPEIPEILLATAVIRDEKAPTLTYVHY